MSETFKTLGIGEQEKMAKQLVRLRADNAELVAALTMAINVLSSVSWVDGTIKGRRYALIQAIGELKEALAKHAKREG